MSIRILQVSTVYYPELQFGGPPQKIHALSRGLAARGHRLQVITLHSGQPTAHHQIMLDNITVQYLPWLGYHTRQLPLQLKPLATAIRQADIVHIYGLYNLLGPAAAWIAKRMGRPFLLEPQGMFTPRARNQRLKRAYQLLFTNRMLNSATRVIAQSPGEAKELAQLVANERIIIRQNGIDLSQFQKLPSRMQFRTRHNIASQERIVLFLGRISPIKNLEQLVLAFHQAELPQTRLVLAGPILETDYAGQLRTQISKLGLIDKVLLVGPLYGEDKLAALSAADLFVLPSLFESYGNAAAEAVAAGLPVLLTETCGIAPQIHGRAGLAVPVDQTALADGLRIMLDHNSQRQYLTSCRVDLFNELSWEEPLNQTERLYQEILRGSCSISGSNAQIPHLNLR